MNVPVKMFVPLLNGNHIGFKDAVNLFRSNKVLSQFQNPHDMLNEIWDREFKSRVKPVFTPQIYRIFAESKKYSLMD